MMIVKSLIAVRFKWEIVPLCCRFYCLLFFFNIRIFHISVKSISITDHRKWLSSNLWIIQTIYDNILLHKHQRKKYTRPWNLAVYIFICITCKWQILVVLFCLLQLWQTPERNHWSTWTNHILGHTPFGRFDPALAPNSGTAEILAGILLWGMKRIWIGLQEKEVS